MEGNNMHTASSELEPIFDSNQPKLVEFISAQRPERRGHVVVVLQEYEGHNLVAIASTAGPILATLPPSIQKAPARLAALLDGLVPEISQSTDHYWVQPGYQILAGVAFPVAALMSADRLSAIDRQRVTDTVLTYLALLQKPADQQPFTFVEETSLKRLEDAAHETLLKVGTTKLHAPIKLLEENGETVSEMKGRLRAVEPVKQRNKAPTTKYFDAWLDGYSVEERHIKVKTESKELVAIQTDLDIHKSSFQAVLANGLNAWVRIHFQEIYLGQHVSKRKFISIEMAPERSIAQGELS